MAKTRGISGKRAVAMAAVLCVMVFTSGVALAQPGGGGRGGSPLSPDETKKATELEARSVIEALKLDADAGAKLTEAYQKARVSYAVGMPERQPGGGPGQFQAFRDHADAERGKLKESLAAFLAEDQVTTALATLGSFNRQWDRMVLVLDGFGLEDAALSNGLAELAAYVKASDAARESAMASGDFQAIREAMQTEKSKLDTALAAVLSEAQLAEWKVKTTPQQRGGGGGFRGGQN